MSTHRNAETTRSARPGGRIPSQEDRSEVRRAVRRTATLEPTKKVAASLRGHWPLILNWVRARGNMSAGIGEGFNNKAKLTTEKVYDFRTLEAA
ncbi:MAG TPA: transposase [Pirellulales bacterium]|nr:transposase [Pirellulales bacterium]